MSWQPSCPETDNVEQAATNCQKMPYIKNLMYKATEQAKALAAKTEADCWAIGMEVCPERLQEGQLREHFHAALARSYRPLLLTSANSLALLGGLPHQTSNTEKGQGRGAVKSNLFYVLAPNEGVIFRHWQCTAVQ